MDEDLGFDPHRSLQELENVDWGEPNYPSHLVQTAHRLRRKPINEFTTEDLRIMIGQSIGLPYLIPVALARIEDDPLAGGDVGAGDLLEKVFEVDPQFWQAHPGLRNRADFLAYLIGRQLADALRAIERYKAWRAEEDEPAC